MKIAVFNMYFKGRNFHGFAVFDPFRENFKMVILENLCPQNFSKFVICESLRQQNSKTDYLPKSISVKYQIIF